MTIFQEIISEDYLTVSEVKQHLQKIEKERSEDEERELPYELARTIEHVNRFSVLSAKDAKALVKKLLELEKVSPQNACIQVNDVKKCMSGKVFNTMKECEGYKPIVGNKD